MPAIDRQQESDSTRTQSRRLIDADPVDLSRESPGKTSIARAIRAESLTAKQVSVLDILVELLGADDLHTALDAFSCALKKHFFASRVSIALASDAGTLVIEVVSDNGLVQLALDEKKLMLDAMNECLKEENSVCFSAVGGDIQTLEAHVALRSNRADISSVTTPCYHDAKPIAVLMIERNKSEPIDQSTIELLEHVAIVAAPILSFRHDAEQSAFRHAATRWNVVLKRSLLHERFGTRFLLILFFGILLMTTLVPFQRTVSADAELVPKERRMVIAPFDGFIDQLSVERGQSVVEGQVLAQLEQRELELESTRRDGDLAGAEADFRSAIASHDRQATVVARAHLARERALRALTDQRLERIDLRAPVAGLVVNGVTANTVGAPVHRGEVLFEIAQSDGYEVHIMVHERDIREIHNEQRGTLSLRGRSGVKFGLAVHTIHPVAESINGVSRFRVRATLQALGDITTRPGESGIAKLNVGKATLLDLWGRPIRQHVTELWWRFSQ
ncbi:MAG: efflux RND transporter periplasmic adaptor subunit [Granulosicoccus sp.]